jgi:transcriptional regulator with XRE-family HTH domain
MAKKLQKSDMFSPIFNRLIDLCENNNTTVTTLLDKFTNSRSAINAWKNGNINTELLPKIANDLNISLEFLLTGKEAQINNLSDNEQEMLDVFSKFDDREQIKLIGKLEELYRQKQIKESQQPAALKVSRSPDRKFRRTEISKEELEKINNLPEDNDI